jgi:hypothetical protein
LCNIGLYFYIFKEKEMNFFRKHFLLLAFPLALAAFPLHAETDVESETVENETVESETVKNETVESETSITLQITSLPEAKFIVSQSFTVPVLQGSNPLVKKNNIKFGIDAEVTPISMSLLGEMVFTPVAFIELAAGGMIGSGWNIKLFGSDVIGIGKNVPSVSDDPAKAGKTSADGSAFDGTFLGARFGGAFQFDLAAVIPGDWNHVLFRSYHEMGCKVYTGAGKGDAWFFESDHGENQNGWVYYGNYLVGYKMPIFLTTVALLAEMKKYLYDTPEGDAWGDSLARWDFGLILNFTITKKFSAALLTQFRLYRNYSNFAYKITYSDEDKKSPDYDRYYRDREITDGRTFSFYRVAAVLKYKLR